MASFTNHNFSALRLKELASSQQAENKGFFGKFKKKNSSQIDKLFHDAHNKEYPRFNCLVCANCCRSISPIITYRDVERMAKALRIKPSAVVEKYLKVDADGDFVFLNAPCPFILPDNYCSIYESRPTACREYPHTDRKNMAQILNITLKNVSVCPIVYNVVERIKGKE